MSRRRARPEKERGHWWEVVDLLVVWREKNESQNDDRIQAGVDGYVKQLYTHTRKHTLTHSLGWCRKDGVVVVVLLLLVEDLQLEEELLLVEDLGVGGVQLRGRLVVGLLVRGDVLVVLQLPHLGLVVLGLLGSLRGAL